MITRKPVDLIRIHLSSDIGCSASKPIRPNSKFDGQIKIQLCAPIQNATVSLTLKGIEVFRPNEKSSNDIQEKKLYSVPLKLWDSSISMQDDMATLSEGMHVFYFRAQMPDVNYPGSIKTANCEYKYSLQAEVVSLPLVPTTPSASGNGPSIINTPTATPSAPYTSINSDDDMAVLASCERELVYMPLLIPSMMADANVEIDEILFSEKRGKKVKPLVHLYANVQGCEAWPGSTITINYGAKSQTNNAVSKVTAALHEHVVGHTRDITSTQTSVYEFDRVLCQEVQNVSYVSTPKPSDSNNNSNNNNNDNFFKSSSSPTESKPVFYEEEGAPVCDFQTLALKVPETSVGCVGSEDVTFSHYLRITLSIPTWLSVEQTVSIDTQIPMFSPPPLVESSKNLTAGMAVSPSCAAIPDRSAILSNVEGRNAMKKGDSINADSDHDMILEAVARMRQQETMRPFSDGCLLRPDTDVTDDKQLPFSQTELSWEAFWANSESANYSVLDEPPFYYDLDPNDLIPPILARIDRIDHPPVPVPKSGMVPTSPGTSPKFDGNRRTSLVAIVESAILPKRNEQERVLSIAENASLSRPTSSHSNRYKARSPDVSTLPRNYFRSNTGGSQRHKKSDSVSSNQSGTSSKPRLSFQSDSRSQKSVHNSGGHERPQSARSNRGHDPTIAASPSRRRRQYARSPIKNNSDERTSFVISKPLPGLPIPIEIFTDEKVLEKQVAISKDKERRKIKGRVTSRRYCSGNGSHHSRRRTSHDITSSDSESEGEVYSIQTISSMKVTKASERAIPVFIGKDESEANADRAHASGVSVEDLSVAPAGEDKNKSESETTYVNKEGSTLSSKNSQSAPGLCKASTAIEAGDSVKESPQMRKSKSMGFCSAKRPPNITTNPSLLSVETKIISPEELAAAKSESHQTGHSSALEICAKNSEQQPQEQLSSAGGDQKVPEITTAAPSDTNKGSPSAELVPVVGPGTNSIDRSLSIRLGKRIGSQDEIMVDPSLVLSMPSTLDLTSFTMEGSTFGQRTPTRSPHTLGDERNVSAQDLQTIKENRATRNSKDQELYERGIDESSSKSNVGESVNGSTREKESLKSRHHSHHYSTRSSRKECESTTVSEPRERRHKSCNCGSGSSSRRREGESLHRHRHRDGPEGEERKREYKRSSSRHHHHRHESSTTNGSGREPSRHHSSGSSSSHRRREHQHRHHHSTSRSGVPTISKELRKSMFKELPPIPPSTEGSGDGDKRGPMPSLPLSHINTMKALSMSNRSNKDLSTKAR